MLGKALTLSAAGAAAGGGEVDPNFNQTVLLLHGDGTNGAQNNTFLDSSTNNFTITRNGNTTQGTFSPFSLPDGRWSNFFDGTGDYLSIADNAAFDLSNSSFTIEAWIYMTAGSGTVRLIVSQIDSGNNGAFILYVNTSNKLTFLYNPGSVTSLSGATSLNLNEWIHVVVTRSGNDFALYVNGIRDDTLTSTVTITNSNLNVVVGADASGIRRITGYISNLRWVLGSSVYNPADASITVPTAPLTAVSGTSLLTCQSNLFVDNSSNAFAITVNGNPKVTPFSPFAPTAAYDPAVNGGSGYFDGTGDYLSIAYNSAFLMGTSIDFCIEGWIYPTEAPADSDAIYASYPDATSNNWIIWFRSGKLGVYQFPNINFTTNAFESTSTISINAWTHFAFTRSGSVFRLFINGVQEDTYTGSVSFGASNKALTIGRYDALTTSNFNGYISNLRHVVGSAIYTSAFTPPSAPLTAITNTVLLANFTNAGIYDNTGKNNLETVADAQIDTTTKKYGTGSMEFDGTGDWLIVPNSPDLQLGTGDFTIEFWVYLATGDAGSARGLVAKGGASTGWLVSLDSSEKVVFTYTTSTITSSGAITTNAWNHIAVVREGTGSNETKIYIGGTNDGTGTVSTNFNQTEVMYIGANRAAGDPMKGFIDDLRITKGVARYTTTFTPPSRAFPDL